MALNNYSTDLNVVTVNGRIMTDWGNAEPPLNEAPIDPKSTLRRGQGGNAIRLDRRNPGREVTLTLNPGGEDSAFMQGLINSGAAITYGRAQVGTLETVLGAEGVIVNDGPVGRGGSTDAGVTDDVYIMQFNSWTQTKGG